MKRLHFTWPWECRSLRYWFWHSRIAVTDYQVIRYRRVFGMGKTFTLAVIKDYDDDAYERVMRALRERDGL